MIILIASHILILLNLQFTAWPEMLSFPYMIDKGFVIYKDFHHVYQPLLTYLLLGTYKLFGFNILTLKTFTYVLIALIDFVLFIVVKKLTKNNRIAILSLFVYIFLQPVFDGNMLWYDVAVILPALLSLYFVESSLFLSGFFVAIAFLTKQQAVLLGIPIFIYLLIKKEKLKSILKFIYGCITPVVFLGILLLKFNLISDYLFWTFEFPLIHLPKIEGYAIAPNTKEIGILMLMILTVVVGFVTNYKKIRPIFYVLSFSLAFLILSAFPRFSLFHLQPALAVFIVLIGYLFNLGNEESTTSRSRFLLTSDFIRFWSDKYFVLLLIPILYLWKGVILNPVKETRFYSQSDVNMGIEIKKTVGNEKVYFLGPSSINYVLSNTVSSKPWIENYVWHFEIPKLQESVIAGWRDNPPTFIYWSRPKEGNWYDLATYQPEKIVEYIRQNYMKIDEYHDIEIWRKK